MSDASEARAILANALHKLLKPLVRLLLRNGVTYAEFANLAKLAYVEVAHADFAVSGRKQSMTRVSVLTGIHRHEVGKLLRQDHTVSSYTPRHNRMASVINGWMHDAEYSQEGVARDLRIDTEFAALVARHGGDVTTRAMLDELRRVGAIKYPRHNYVALLVQGFVPQYNTEDLVHIFGDSTADLLETLDHNLIADAAGRRLQMSVVYNNLPDNVLYNLELVSRDRAMAFLQDLNQFYATQDRDNNPALEGSGRNRAGIGLYYFQQPSEETEPV